MIWEDCRRKVRARKSTVVPIPPPPVPRKPPRAARALVRILQPAPCVTGLLDRGSGPASLDGDGQRSRPYQRRLRASPVRLQIMARASRKGSWRLHPAMWSEPDNADRQSPMAEAARAHGESSAKIRPATTLTIVNQQTGRAALRALWAQSIVGLPEGEGIITVHRRGGGSPLRLLGVIRYVFR